jgi:hypothetical protein
MVAFDGHGRPAREGDGFNYVGIQCALGKEICTADFLGFFLKDIDEFCTNEFALLFRVSHAR